MTRNEIIDQIQSTSADGWFKRFAETFREHEETQIGSAEMDDVKLGNELYKGWVTLKKHSTWPGVARKARELIGKEYEAKLAALRSRLKARPSNEEPLTGIVLNRIAPTRWVAFQKDWDDLAAAINQHFAAKPADATTEKWVCANCEQSFPCGQSMADHGCGMKKPWDQDELPRKLWTAWYDDDDYTTKEWSTHFSRNDWRRVATAVDGKERVME